MPKSAPILTNFTSGELDPRVEGRPDLTRYYNGCLILENWLIDPTGGLKRRPGAIFAAEAKYNDKDFRLIEFIFNVDDKYVIEMGDQYMRFYRNGGAILESNVTISSSTAANPIVVTATGHGFSDGDEVYISGVSGQTQINNRRFIVANKTANTFELNDKSGGNIDGSGWSAGTGGTVARVYEIATPFLEADLFEIQYGQTDDIIDFTHENYHPQKLTRSGHTSWTIVDVPFTKGPMLDDNDTAVTITPSADTGTGITLTASSGIFQAGHEGSLWRIKNGYVRINTYSSATLISDADVLYGVSLGTGPGATTDWAEGAWSDVRGYPSAYGLFEGRSFFGGSTYQPRNVWASQSQDLENMLKGSGDSDALIYEISAIRSNRIRWFEPSSNMNAGTAGGVFTLTGGGVDDPLTPSNVRARSQTTYGTELIKPYSIGGFIYYMQNNGRTLREISYSLERDQFIANKANLLSKHITKSKIVEMMAEQSPDNNLWCVRTDGEIAVMTREINEEVLGWSRQIFGGVYSTGNAVVFTAAAIPNGEYDQKWFGVRRTINGETKQYIEYLAEEEYDDQEDYNYLDSSLTYDGAATDTITGLWHLEGETVQVIADGATHPDVTVEDGSITLNGDYSVVHIGYHKPSKVQTMRLEGGSATGTSQAKVRRVYKVAVRFYRTLGAKIGYDDSHMEVITYRKPSDPMNEAVPLFTGDKEIQFPVGYTKEPRIQIECPDALPCTILAIMPKSEVYDS